MALTNKGYDTLKFIALVLLPAAASLYTGIAALWGWGDVSQVVGTISVVDTFLGVILHLSSNPARQPVDGQLTVTTNPDGSAATGQIEFNTHPADLIDKPAATIKVVRVPSSVVGAPQPGPTGGR